MCQGLAFPSISVVPPSRVTVYNMEFCILWINKMKTRTLHQLAKFGRAGQRQNPPKKRICYVPLMRR